MIVPRAEWTAGLANPSAGKEPAWVSGGGQKRPPLNAPCSHVVVHYTGAKTTYADKDAYTAVRQLFLWAHANNKGDEYNYIISPDGRVWEWAGNQRGAHCTSWNTDSVGVLFLLGVGEIPTLEQAASLLALRKYLVGVSTITQTHRVGQHREYLGTSPGPAWKPNVGDWLTDCPGQMVIARWPMYSAPLAVEPPPAPPTEEAMKFCVCYDSPMFPGQGAVFMWDGKRWVHQKPEPYWESLVPLKLASATPDKDYPRADWVTIAKFV